MELDDSDVSDEGWDHSTNDWDLSAAEEEQFNSWKNKEVGFDTCWNNEFFQRELAGIRALATSFFPKLKNQGRVPFMGSLPNHGGKYLSINRKALTEWYNCLKGKASPGSADHTKHLDEMRALRRQMDIYMLRYTGPGRFAGDHPFVVVAALTFGIYCVTLWHSKKDLKKKRSALAQLMHSFGL